MTNESKKEKECEHGKLGIADCYWCRSDIHPPIVPIEPLIAACGDRFGALHRRFDSSFKLLCWEAVGYNSAGEMMTFDGPDPITAVSRLWLALNAK